MIFQDRIEAAERLADALAHWQGKQPLILAIPRGAVPMGQVLARRLGGDLDVVLVRKLGAPGMPEFAVGAVDETGWTYIAPHADQAGATPIYIEHERKDQLARMKARRALYTPARPPIDPAGRVVIVVDDGIATGSTMIAALRAIRARHPAKLIAATAVAPAETVRRLRNEADEVVCLETPSPFFAIGLHFDDFSQVSDEEVVRHLTEARQARTAAAAH
jgi:predicted phosphoribosyltransferase